MKWQGRRKSDNVEDRRGLSGGKIAVGGGVIGIIVLLLNLFGGENAKMLTFGGSNGGISGIRKEKHQEWLSKF